MVLQNKIKNGMNGASMTTSLTHMSRLGDNDAGSETMAMHISVSFRVALAAEMHSGQGAKLELSPDGMPLYIQARIEYSIALLACMINLHGSACIAWVVH